MSAEDDASSTEAERGWVEAAGGWVSQDLPSWLPEDDIGEVRGRVGLKVTELSAKGFVPHSPRGFVCKLAWRALYNLWRERGRGPFPIGLPGPDFPEAKVDPPASTRDAERCRACAARVLAPVRERAEPGSPKREALDVIDHISRYGDPPDGRRSDAARQHMIAFRRLVQARCPACRDLRQEDAS